VASQVNPRILPRFGPSRVMRAAVRVFLVAASVLVVIAFMRPDNWVLLAIPIMVGMSTNGFNMPNTTVGALSRHAGHAGSASAVMGTLQFVMGAVSGLTVGLATDNSARPMAALMLLGGIGAVICDLCRPRPPSKPPSARMEGDMPAIRERSPVA